jgi:hypothetical protein
LAGIDQPETGPTGDFAASNIKMPVQAATPIAAPIRLLPVDARLPDDLELLFPPVDDDTNLLARDPSGWRLG